MLLKTIRIPSTIPVSLDMDAAFLSADETIDAVNKIREDFLNGKGILPVLSQERVTKLTDEYEIFRVCPETKQLGNFAGDIQMPHNCVAVIIQYAPADMARDNIYITSDMEAYIISDTGVTVSVINGKKTVENTVLQGKGHITLHGNGDIHISTGNKHTGPAL